ncbi:hypothetical protein [Alkaliphilus peptidifermentans]|uniref:Uncharacterized protein n=1 Tax=Alkaliphilus peptidifermentans DSM 18978 TaxID=1120976 RepID=A0A1G5HD08_9FIRM|nr:hypothetical protein [Alkaliphilus peptidifermentans]SCY61634.1 hypothetical protein SAMN03080606_01964 [Alkaliphilus peptidifermentans DSM 18978]
MIKKFMYYTAFILLIIAFSSVSAFGNETDQPKQTIQVVTPERNITTDSTNLVFELTAAEGTKVIIQVYYNNSIVIGKENFVAEGDAINIEMGALRRDWIEVALRKGKNKVEITAIYEDESEDVVVRIIDVKGIEEVKQNFERKISEPATELLENLINTGRK